MAHRGEDVGKDMVGHAEGMRTSPVSTPACSLPGRLRTRIPVVTEPASLRWTHNRI
jgi:hypothetical protein